MDRQSADQKKTHQNHTQPSQDDSIEAEHRICIQRKCAFAHRSMSNKLIPKRERDREKKTRNWDDCAS